MPPAGRSLATSSVGKNWINTVVNNLQFTTAITDLLISDNQSYYEEIKHNKRGYMDKVNFKRRNLPPTLASHQKLEIKTGLANWSYTEPWKQANGNTKKR